MGLELTTDKYPPITSQTRYPLRHAAFGGKDWLVSFTVPFGGKDWLVSFTVPFGG